MNEKLLKKQEELKLFERALLIEKKALTKVRANLDKKATDLEVSEKKQKQAILKLFNEKELVWNAKLEVLKKIVNSLKKEEASYQKKVSREIDSYAKVLDKESISLKNIKSIRFEKLSKERAIKKASDNLKDIYFKRSELLDSIDSIKNTKKFLKKNLTELSIIDKKLISKINISDGRFLEKTSALKTVKSSLSISSKELKKVNTELNRAINSLEKTKKEEKESLSKIKKEKNSLGTKKNEVRQDVEGLEELKSKIRFYARRMNKWYKSKGLKEPIKLNF